MTPEEKQLLTDISIKLDNFLDVYHRTNFIDRTVFDNKVYFRNDVYLPTKTAFFGSNTPATKQAAVTPASGGTTVDAEARAAINTVITRLQTIGLTS